ncbi:threonine/serine exporter family protein [Gemella morbillorum]|uniref:threonine/serine exporter family protein n=1 Tax=Gemella morbillorum TaxID=29391 RepID=UPI001CAE04A8|nr:threonine/serine exporter family protein [Gemella morbillorum]MBF1211874.1 threonine/serine exporter family protein [Gemella morbillorum]
MIAVFSHLLLLLYHFVFSFISSVSFAIVCDVPRKTLATGGVIGAIGWCGYWEMWSHGQSVFMSSLVCSLLLANISQICAIKFKNPLTVYFIPGLVPVVPGVTIYDAFRTLLLDEYGNSARIFLNSFYGAVGLAVGIIIADSIFRVVLSPLLQKRQESK